MSSGAPLGRGWPRPTAFRQATIAALIIALVGVVLPTPVAANHWAPPRTVYVPETGHTTDGLFLELWREQRSLLGDPVTEEVRARTSFSADGDDQQIVQYYERLALVYLPNEAPGEQVQTLPLGRDALDAALQLRPTPALQQAVRRTACGTGSAATCRGFAATGHTLRGDFRAFWEAGDTGRWLGLPLTEALRAPDGALVQYLERGVLRQRSGRSVDVVPLGLTTARRLELTTDPVVPPAEIPVYDEALFIPPPEPEPEPLVEQPLGWAVGSFGPGPQQGGYQEIVVSLSSQALWAYEAGELVMSTYVSTGTAHVPETMTPIGHWSILVKKDVENMEGTISGEYYYVENVPYVMYFDNGGNAIHGTYWHSNFGAPMSHGCVNLPLDVAAWIYGWAPVGTAVTVVA